MPVNNAMMIFTILIMTKGAFSCFTTGGSLEAHADVVAVTSAINQFSHNVYTTIGARYDNLVFSPYSLHLILTMASRAAHGDTLLEMNQILGPSDMRTEDVDTAYANLITSIFNCTDVDTLSASSIFLGPNVDVDQQFADLSSTNFSTMVDHLSFSDPFSPETRINDFVKQKTDGLFQSVFDNGSLSENVTQIVLVNGLAYDNATWTKPFNPNFTSEADFYVSSTEKVRVQMMMQEGSFDMKLEEKFTTLKLPYHGDFSLYIVLLNSSVAVENPQCLDINNTDDYFSKLTPTNAKIYVPKFEVRFQNDMVQALRSLGMRKAFTQGDLFSNVSISRIPHMAAIKVTESGSTEQNDMAPQTTDSSFDQQPSPSPPEVHVNRPFLFFYRDDRNDGILLHGKFFRPQSNPTDPVSEVTRTVPSCGTDEGNGGGDTASVPTMAVAGWLLSLMYLFFVLGRVFY